MNAKNHWDNAYSTKGVSDRSWSEGGESVALAEVDFAELPCDKAIIDIGGGASTFVQSLVKRGYSDITVLDIAETAINESRSALEDSTEGVQWIVSDVLRWDPTQTYAFWNDRATFHFLVSDQDQRTYIDKVLLATRAGSHISIATFAPDGPESCSGLPVQRWSHEGLAELFSQSCSVVRSGERIHITPWGTSQSFSWVHLLRN